VGSTVYVCKKCDGAKRLLRDLQERTDASPRFVGCQKVCSDHVVGLRVHGRLTWFEQVDSKPRRRALRRLVDGADHGAIPDALERLVVRKRSGSLRH
jgi:hypothetical protein